MAVLVCTNTHFPGLRTIIGTPAQSMGEFGERIDYIKVAVDSLLNAARSTHEK
jgi:hypothetical protein